MIVGFQPVVEMNLVKIRRYEFLSQFVRFRAQERYLESGKHCDQGLGDTVRVHSAVGISGFHLAHGGRDDQ